MSRTSFCALASAELPAAIRDRVGEHREVAVDLQQVLLRQVGGGTIFEEAWGTRAILAADPDSPRKRILLVKRLVGRLPASAACWSLRFAAAFWAAFLVFLAAAFDFDLAALGLPAPALAWSLPLAFSR